MAPRQKKFRVPSYRLHKPSGLAVVTLNERDLYLGQHGSAASHAEYERLIAEWLANGRRLRCDDRPLTIDEMLLPIVEWAREYYPTNGPSSEFENLRYAIRPLRRLYGHTLASEFDAAALKAIRQRLIEEGLARTTINGRIDRIKRVFRRALSEGLVPPEVVTRLRSVEGLRRGRSEARETAPVEPVCWEHVRAVLPHLAPDLRVIVLLMWHTGMRVGEVIRMRSDEIDSTSLQDRGVWVYRPSRHKTAHHGHERRVLLGEHEQELLRPYLCEESPGEVFGADRGARRRKATRHYTRDRVRKSIATACRKAGVPRWHPHRLRHAAATRFRAQGGLDYARIRLGQRTLGMADEYADLDLASAVSQMSKCRPDDLEGMAPVAAS